MAVAAYNMKKWMRLEKEKELTIFLS